MPTTITCADLKNNYDDISRICHETKEPVYITKDGQNDLVVLSNEVYHKQCEDKKCKRRYMKCFIKNILMLKASKKMYTKKLK